MSGVSHTASCFKVHPCGGLSWCPVPFHGRVTVHWTDGPQCVLHSLMDTGAVPTLGDHDSAAVNVPPSAWASVFSPRGAGLGGKLLGQVAPPR